MELLYHRGPLHHDLKSRSMVLHLASLLIDKLQERGIKYIEHIYDYSIKQFYNFEELHNLYDISDKDFLKYYHIVNNIHEDWKALLKEENPLTQEPNKQT